jgi:release factor glutamine methyltransferase
VVSDARPATLGAALAAGRTWLARAGIERAALDAALLLGHVVGLDRAALLARPEQPLSDQDWAAYAALLARRAAGEPVAYLTGRREFFGLEFAVDQRVLVPRPETEHLVELALAHLRALPPGPRLAVDVGTGSGAIAVSLAHALPDLTVVAADVSQAALAVAGANAARHGVAGRVRLVCGSLLDWLGRPVDLIAANLPYLRPAQAHAGIAHEPAIALYGGPDGFALYRRLLAQAPPLLRPGGLLLAEIDPAQRDLALATAGRVAPGWPAAVHPDYAGHPRVLALRRPAGAPAPP